MHVLNRSSADLSSSSTVMQPEQHQAASHTGAVQAGPASLKDSSSIATAGAAHKHAPSEAYELEDLDEDWVAMLNVLDSRLLEVRTM